MKASGAPLRNFTCSPDPHSSLSSLLAACKEGHHNNYTAYIKNQAHSAFLYYHIKMGRTDCRLFFCALCNRNRSATHLQQGLSFLHSSSPPLSPPLLHLSLSLPPLLLSSFLSLPLLLSSFLSLPFSFLPHFLSHAVSGHLGPVWWVSFHPPHFHGVQPACSSAERARTGLPHSSRCGLLYAPPTHWQFHQRKCTIIFKPQEGDVFEMLTSRIWTQCEELE